MMTPKPALPACCIPTPNATPGERAYCAFMAADPGSLPCLTFAAIPAGRQARWEAAGAAAGRLPNEAIESTWRTEIVAMLDASIAREERDAAHSTQHDVRRAAIRAAGTLRRVRRLVCGDE